MINRSSETEEQILEMRAALDAALAAGDRPRENILRGLLGKSLMGSGLIPEAVTQFEAAVKLANQLEDPASKARHLGNLGMALAQLGNYDQAMNSLKRALALGERLELADLRGDALLQIAFLQFHDENPEGAFASLEQVEQLSGEGDLGRRMLAAALRGDIYDHLGQPDQAEEAYRQAMTLADRLENMQAVLTYQELLIKAQIASGKQQEAISEIQDGLNRLKRVEGGEKQAVTLLSFLGDIYYEQEALEKALQTNQAALSLASTQGNQELQIHLLGRLSAIQGERGLPDEAVEYARQSLELAKNENQTLLVASQLVLLGLAYRDQGDAQKAKNILEQAVTMYRREEQSALADQVDGFLAELE